MNSEPKEKIERILEALESPSHFTQDELKDLFSDEESLKHARSILYAKEALARENISTPNVNMEWKKFEQRHKNKLSLTIITSIVTAACIALFFMLHITKDTPQGLKVFEVSQVSQIIRQDTINGLISIHIPRGTQKQISLPDGTKVTLNAESQLTYNLSEFGKNERIVTLNGEGLFDVAKDSLHPFIVQSEKLNTCVLGTVFNIRTYNTEAPKVTLLSGSLKIVSLKNNESLKINPGEQAVLTKQSNICTLKILQTNDITSWCEGSFYFDNQSLAEILCELGRWYNVNVIFKDKTNMDNRLHFKALRSEQLVSIVELLNYISKVPIILDEKTIIVGK